MYKTCHFGMWLLPLIILVFAIWQTAYSKWIIIIAAALLLIHVLFCSCCKSCEVSKKAKPKRKPKKKKK